MAMNEIGIEVRGGGKTDAKGRFFRENLDVKSASGRVFFGKIGLEDWHTTKYEILRNNIV